MLKIKVTKVMTLFELLKKVYKGKLSATTEFIIDGNRHNVLTIFNKGYQCNYASLNEEVVIVKEKK